MLVTNSTFCVWDNLDTIRRCWLADTQLEPSVSPHWIVSRRTTNNTTHVLTVYVRETNLKSYCLTVENKDNNKSVPSPYEAKLLFRL